MIVISDTTPINYLVLIGRIDILKELFGHVIIPRAVWDEFHKPGTPDLVRTWADGSPAWLEVKEASSSFITSVRQLGAGEREAIALANELRADAVLMDERKGTKEARRHGLTAFGTLAILEKAAQRGLLDLADSFRELAQTNFRFPRTEILEDLLERNKRREPGGPSQE
ncbi:MAG: DUF3368 domain-containing protein [Acidobacteriota bacterium]